MSNQQLKIEREQRGWSQARVAEQIGTDPGTISRWERGASSPSPFFRERLSQLYGKTVRELGLLEVEQNATSEDGGAEKEKLEAKKIAPGREALESASAGQRLLACFSIILGWVTGLLVLLFYRSNRFVVFYSLQSVCFFGLAHVITIVAALAARPEPGNVSALSVITSMIGSMTALIAAITWIVALTQAARGKYFRFPIIGVYCERIASALARPTH